MTPDFFAALLVKLTLLLAGGLALDRLWRSRPLATAAMWNVTLLAVLLLPIMAVLSPQWLLPVLPQSTPTEITLAELPQHETSAPDPSAAPLAADAPAAAPIAEPAADTAHSAAPRPAAALPSPGISPIGYFWLAAAIVYALGAIAFLARLALGWHVVGQLRRQAEPLTDPDWLADFDRWRCRLN